jgi:hypothetical protein
MTVVFRRRQKLAVVLSSNAGRQGHGGDAPEASDSDRVRGGRFLSAVSRMDSDTQIFLAEIGTKIGNQLRETYDPVLREPLPDRFCGLLNELAHACE